MAQKQVPQKTQPKTAPPPVRKKPATFPTSYQFDVATLAVPRIVASQGKAAHLSPAEFASFEDAKDRAIDFLIDFIADCEQQLWDLSGPKITRPMPHSSPLKTVGTASLAIGPEPVRVYLRWTLLRQPVPQRAPADLGVRRVTR